MSARFCLVLALGAAATPLAAQTRLTYGETTTGRLTVADSQFSDGSRYRAYHFTAAGGDTIAAELESDDFDAMLVLTDAGGNRLVANDDGGEQCNARLRRVLTTAGTYRLYANARAPHGLGTYRLRLARGPRAAPADTTCRHFLGTHGIIQVGESLSSILTAKDFEFTDTTHFRRYTLPVRARQTLTIDLRSDDFDAFLLLERGRGERLVENDDGGGGCHARIVYTTVEDRPLAVVVNTAVARQTGGFTVSVRNGASPTEPKSTCRTAAHAIRVGQTRTGALGADDRLVTRDSTYAQEWRLEGRQGQAVTVDLASKEFDAFLFVMGPGIESALQNDDAGGSCNARLSFTFREDGTYYIFVNSAQKHATGAFTLEVTPGTKPPSLVRCARGR